MGKRKRKANKLEEDGDENNKEEELDVRDNQKLIRLETLLLETLELSNTLLHDQGKEDIERLKITTSFIHSNQDQLSKQDLKASSEFALELLWKSISYFSRFAIMNSILAIRVGTSNEEENLLLLQQQQQQQQQQKNGKMEILNKESRQKLLEKWRVNEMTELFGAQISSMRAEDENFGNTAEEIANLIQFLKTTSCAPVSLLAEDDVGWELIKHKLR